MLILAALTLILSYLCVIAPYRTYKQECRVKKFKKQYHYFKLKAVKASYPSIQDLSFKEIEQKYNLNLIYDNIGRHIS